MTVAPGLSMCLSLDMREQGELAVEAGDAAVALMERAASLEPPLPGATTSQEEAPLPVEADSIEAGSSMDATTRARSKQARSTSSRQLQLEGLVQEAVRRTSLELQKERERPPRASEAPGAAPRKAAKRPSGTGSS